MAGLTVTVGPKTVTRSWANDAKASAMWTAFADSRGIDPALPAGQRLEQAVDAMVRDVLAEARHQHQQAGIEAAKEQTETEIALE